MARNWRNSDYGYRDRDQDDERYYQDQNTGFTSRPQANRSRSYRDFDSPYGTSRPSRYNQFQDWRDRDLNEDRNVFERSGDRIRNTWNDWTDRNDPRRSDRDSDDRNIFQRAGDKIRNVWNDLTDDEQDDYRNRYGDRDFNPRSTYNTPRSYRSGSDVSDYQRYSYGQRPYESDRDFEQSGRRTQSGRRDWEGRGRNEW